MSYHAAFELSPRCIFGFRTQWLLISMLVSPGGVRCGEQGPDSSGRLHGRRRRLPRLLGRDGSTDEEQSHCEQVFDISFTN